MCGMSTGYAIISIDQMFYKINFPTEFYYVKIKYAGSESDIHKYSNLAMKAGCVVMLPHVNQTNLTSLRQYDGENVIQQGLSIIKGVGEKAGEEIQKERELHGEFIDYDDFYDRCKSRAVTTRVINILQECGALEFNEKKYINRVIKYNSTGIARR